MVLGNTFRFSFYANLEITKGVSDWFYFEYYFVHAGLIFVTLFLTYVMGMKTSVDD